jgi:hypothetical protein
MKTKIFAIILVSLAIIFSVNTSNANEIDGPGDNTGVSGKVIDKNTGESLAGAVVLVKGTNIKTYTDLEGNFTITDLTPGTYDIEVSFISYQNFEVADVTTTADQSTSVEIAILPE